MPIWKWKERFIDERLCAVEADTEEEALEKMLGGKWLYEDTYNFFSDGLISELEGPYEE